jgi:SAM-dependent methyltransferase
MDKDKNLSCVFDCIAPAWYGVRHHTIFKTELEQLAKRWQQGRLINLGCGHGPDFIPFKHNFELFGIDNSSEMLKLAKKYADRYGFKVNLMHADICELPVSDAFFDQVIAVASLHHLRGKDRQLKAISEIFRILKHGGEAFLTVWNYWQPRFWFGPKEVMMAFKLEQETVYRFYYLYSYSELRDLVRRNNFNIIPVPGHQRFWFLEQFKRNICLLLKKPY